jgi:hypothetical protein
LLRAQKEFKSLTEELGSGEEKLAVMYKQNMDLQVEISTKKALFDRLKSKLDEQELKLTESNSVLLEIDNHLQ